MKSFGQAAGVGQHVAQVSWRLKRWGAGSDKDFEKSMSTLMSSAAHPLGLIASCAGSTEPTRVAVLERSMLSSDLLTEPLQQIADKP